jgi:serine protease Do
MHPARLPWLLLGLCLSLRPAAAGEDDLGRADAAGRALRRSPVVEVYEKCHPAVAFLTFPIPKGGNPLLNEFFAVPGVAEDVGMGSGFFLHESGYLLTNAHAVSNIAMLAHVSDGKSYPVDVVGVDRALDLAVVRIHSPRAVPVVRLARSRDAMIGETVVIIGSPHGLKQSCSTGVLAGLGREVTASGLKLHNMLQLDAAINPGSSGGPVLNVVGEVMGVVAVHKQDGQGLGFAIPVETVRRALPRLLDVERRQGIATGLSFVGDDSATVAQILPNSPAEEAGLQPGDVIRSLPPRRVLSEADFHLGLLDRTPGDRVALKVLRGERALLTELRLGARPRPNGEALLARLGLKAIPLDPLGAARIRLRVAKGVVLTEVKEGIYPDKQRPEPGDVLARINDCRPDDMDHIGRLLADSKPGEGIRLVFLRKRDKAFTRIDVTVTPSK